MHLSSRFFLLLRLNMVAVCVLQLLACTPIGDALTSPILIADSDANPVPIHRQVCSNCEPVVFRDALDSQGTLNEALIIIQSEYPDLLIGYNLEYIQGVMIDLQGRTTINTNSSWELLFSDDTNLTAAYINVKSDGSTTRQSSVYTQQNDYAGFITAHNGARGLNGIKRPFSELLALPLADSSDVVSQAINDPSYQPSGLSHDAVLYFGGIVGVIANYYDPNRTEQDMVSIVAYYNRGIAVIIPNENAWTIGSIGPDHPVVEGWPQELIDEQYHGTVDLFEYFDSRQVFSYSLTGD